LTVISKYAYKAVWDASDLSKGLMSTRALFLAQKKIVEDSRTPFDRLAIGHENLNKLIEKYPEMASRKLGLEKQLEKQYLLEESAVRRLDTAERQRLHTLLTSAEKQEKAAARMERARQRVQSQYKYHDDTTLKDRMTAAGSPQSGAAAAGSGLVGAGIIGRLGPAAVGAAAAYKTFGAASGTVKEGIQANRQVERAAITFEHFSGSAGKAEEMLVKLRGLSAEAGVSFKALADGTSRFMVQGFTDSDAIKTMSQIAEVTGGIPDRMDRLSIAFAQVRSKGQLYAEELQQMNEAGFSPLIELAQVLGVRVADVRKEIERGNVTWDVFAKAIDTATNAGGRFDGFLEKFKGTSLGSANETAAAWEDASSRIGRAWEPIERLWSRLSTIVAKDLGAAADVFSGGDGEGSGADAKAEQLARIAQREKELADLREANRKREQDAVNEINARNQEQSTTAMGGLIDQQFASIKELIPDQELAKFERVYSLLTDYNKEQAKREAVMDFHNGLGLGDMTALLDAEARAELKKTEQLEKQVELRNKQQQVIERSKQTAGKFASQEQQQIDALAELEMARRYGGLSQPDFDRESKKVVATESKGSSSLASSMRVGSQEAYQFMAGTQDRNQREKQTQFQTTKVLQERMIKAIEKVEAAVKDAELPAAG
jgi:tape measure domain-containing protein